MRFCNITTVSMVASKKECAVSSLSWLTENREVLNMGDKIMEKKIFSFIYDFANFFQGPLNPLTFQEFFKLLIFKTII